MDDTTCEEGNATQQDPLENLSDRKKQEARYVSSMAGLSEHFLNVYEPRLVFPLPQQGLIFLGTSKTFQSPESHYLLRYIFILHFCFPTNSPLTQVFSFLPPPLSTFLEEMSRLMCRSSRTGVPLLSGFI